MIGGGTMKKIATVALTTALAFIAVDVPANAATAKLGLKNNVLVQMSTGKVVKGFKVYKNRLYKEGNIYLSRKKYGKGANMQLYYKGKLDKGFYMTRDTKYVFRDGKLIKGNYTHYQGNGQMDYKDGIRISSTYITYIGKDIYLYQDGKLRKGPHVMKYDDGEDDAEFIVYRLFIDGKVPTGIHTGTYKNITYTFKDGLTKNPFFYKGKVYVNGQVAEANTYVLCDGTLYYSHKLFTGEYNDHYYENGQKRYNVFVQTYEQMIAQALTLKEAIGKESDEGVAKQLKVQTDELLTYLKEHKRSLYETYGGRDDDGYMNEIVTVRKIGQQLSEIDAMTKQLNGAAADTHEALVKVIDDYYKTKNLHHVDGVLLDGAYEGNIYEKGNLVTTVVDREQSNAQQAYNDKLSAFNNATTTETSETLQSLLEEVVEALNVSLQKSIIEIEESENPTYPNAVPNAYSARADITRSVDELRIIENGMKQYHLQVDTTSLRETMEKAYAKIGETVSLAEVDNHAAYTPIELGNIEGTYNEDGFAYITLHTKDREGIYKLDDRDVRWRISENPELMTNMTEQKAADGVYLEQGTHYIALKGKPNMSFQMQLTKKTYNFDTKTTWTASKSEYGGDAVIIPYYKYQSLSTTLTLTNDQNLQIFALPSNGYSGLEEIILTDQKKGKTYPVKKLSMARFSTNAPNGTYKLTIVPPKDKVGSQLHVAISYMLSSPLVLNQKTYNRDTINDTFTLNLNKETKIKFKLEDQYEYNTNKNKFKLYDHQHKLVKSVTLKDGQKSREFTYTVKKGRYSIKAKNLDITTTVKK